MQACAKSCRYMCSRTVIPCYMPVFKNYPLLPPYTYTLINRWLTTLWYLIIPLGILQTSHVTRPMCTWGCVLAIRNESACSHVAMMYVGLYSMLCLPRYAEHPYRVKRLCNKSTGLGDGKFSMSRCTY